MKLRKGLGLAVVMIGSMLVSVAGYASQVSVVAPQTFAPIVPGEIIPLSVLANFSTSLITADLTLSFDSRLFQVSEVSVAPAFDYSQVDQTYGTPPNIAIDNTAGTVTVTNLFNFYGAPVDTDFYLLSLVGMALAPGTFDVNLSQAGTWYDMGEFQLVAGTDFKVNPAVISVVPLPPAVWLLVSGLFGLLTMQRRHLRA